MYKAIFFDVDDTLLDFTLCSKEALEKTFSKFHLAFSEEAFACFQRVDNMLWTRQKQGELTIEQVLEQRFLLIAGELQLAVSGDDLSNEFIYQLGFTDILTPYAEEILNYLHGKYKLFVTSNGILDMQLKRLSLCGLKKYFKDIYVSDDVGFEKPDRRFFDECLKRSGLSAPEVLMVGDSFAADIEGAAGAELATCWYNPHGKSASEGITASPTYTIKSLSKLQEVI